MAVNWEDPAVLQAVLGESYRIRDPRIRRIAQKAAVETGLVESRGRNLSGGDADSAGWRQERRSLYRNPTNVRASARRFFKEFVQQYQPGEKSFQVAAQVQRPRADLRGRYHDVAADAARVLQQAGAGGGGTGGDTQTLPGGSGGVQGVSQGSEGLLPLLQALEGQKQPAVPSSGALTPPAASAAPAMPSGAHALQSGGGPAPKPDVSSLLALAAQAGGGDVLQGGGGQTTVGGGSGGGGAGKPQSGVASFEGKKVAAWIAPALEYARSHGWKGSVTSGYRSKAEQTRIYNSGVRPAAKPGTSNHEFTDFPGGAIDVSDPEQLARILQRSPYRRRLRWAGAKDRVHFSHPHGGGY